MYVVLLKYHCTTNNQEPSIIPLSVCNYPYTAKRAVKYYALRELRELKNVDTGSVDRSDEEIIKEWDYMPSGDYVGIYGKYQTSDEEYIDIIRRDKSNFATLGTWFGLDLARQNILRTIYYVEVPKFEADHNIHSLISPIPKNPRLITNLRTSPLFRALKS